MSEVEEVEDGDGVEDRVEDRVEVEVDAGVVEAMAIVGSSNVVKSTCGICTAHSARSGWDVEYIQRDGVCVGRLFTNS